jgi:hypothetical protein
MLPKAEMPSYQPKRLRLRIPSKRGDHTFFENLMQRWQSEFPATELACNLITGSLLVTGVAPDADTIAEFGRRQALFECKPAVSKTRTWIGGVETAMLSLNRKILRGSGGSMDLTSALFAALVIFGISELIRGNFKSPPWYTAFWYAFGVYSKALLDLAVKQPD